MTMQYHELAEGRGRLLIDVTEQNAKDLWTLAHAIQRDLRDDPKKPVETDLVTALLTGLTMATGKPLEWYPQPPTLPITLRRQPRSGAWAKRWPRRGR